MPFDKIFDDRYHLGIKETAKELGILAERVDEQIYREGILDRIYRQIEVADVVVADMTGKNPNVFYEVGYAHAKGKLTILLTSDADDIPFDLKHRRHVVYGESISALRERLKQELEWAKAEVENVRNSRIKVSARTIGGDLKKTTHMAHGEVLFTIDLSNDSKKLPRGGRTVLLLHKAMERAARWPRMCLDGVGPPRLQQAKFSVSVCSPPRTRRLGASQVLRELVTCVFVPRRRDKRFL